MKIIPIDTYANFPSLLLPPEEQGCLEEFENTAAFSRDYQQAQRCMCDGEHMFSCPPDGDLDLRFPEHHKSLVAKKFGRDVSCDAQSAGLPPTDTLVTMTIQDGTTTQDLSCCNEESTQDYHHRTFIDLPEF